LKLVGAGLQAYLKQENFNFPEFRQRPPWIGADLQTVRNSFAAPAALAAEYGRLSVPIGGADGSALSLAYTPAAASPEGANDSDSGKALVLVHGLGGSEDSSYMKNAAAYFSRRGWQVYRMNYRGVGPSRATSKAPYSAGLTGDLRSVLRSVSAQKGIEDICVMGFSLGGQLILRTFGEGDVDTKVRAAVTVSAPLDLAASQRRLERRRNAPYVRYIVGNMKRDMAGICHKAITINIDKISSVLAFDDHVIAPYFGFANAQDYYRCVSCLPLIGKIGLPTLAIHSADDPWIPVADYHKADWPASMPVGAAILRRGGHVGFHSANAKAAWFEPVSESFFGKFT